LNWAIAAVNSSEIPWKLAGVEDVVAARPGAWPAPWLKNKSLPREVLID
jgi:hypothetical protein